jgi:hypothetical protein
LLRSQEFFAIGHDGVRRLDALWIPCALQTSGFRKRRSSRRTPNSASACTSAATR